MTFSVSSSSPQRESQKDKPSRTTRPRYSAFMSDDLATAAEWIRDAKAIVVVTGAGVSAESTIPTFRDAMEGLWAEFDPQTLATPEAFAADPEMVTRWYDMRRVKCAQAVPNAGHLALADIEKHVSSRGGTMTLLTQNVDGLHTAAGSKNVVELHGSLRVWRCTKTGQEVTPGPEPFEEFPPMSEAGAPLRPSVVWFGEMLSEGALETAFAASGSCDLFMSVGTSAVVYPAAGFVELAKRAGARTFEVNKDQTPTSGIVDLTFRGRSGEILPELVTRAFG